MIHDLKCLAFMASDDTLKRIGAGVSPGDGEAGLRRLIFEQGCKLTEEDAQELATALLLAATLPDDDHAAFVTSTAVLLADRLQFGAGHDDLYWHWDAFQQYYQLIDAAGRAAIFQGYLCAHRNGRVHLSDPPRAALSTTLSGDLARTRLQDLVGTADPEPVRVLIEALSGGDTDAASQIWAGKHSLHFRADDAFGRGMISAFRHLFEVNEGWDPYKGTAFTVLDQSPRLIPFLPE